MTQDLPTISFHFGKIPSLQLLTLYHFLRNYFPHLKIKSVEYTSKLQYLKIDKYFISSIRDFSFYLGEIQEWLDDEVSSLLEYLHCQCVSLEEKHGWLGWRSKVSKLGEGPVSGWIPGLERLSNLEVLHQRIDSEIVFPELRAGMNREYIDQSGARPSVLLPSYELNQHPKAANLELFYANKKIIVQSDFSLRLILKELQNHLRQRGYNSSNHPIKQVIQCQIYIYIANLVPKSYLDEFPLLRQFIIDAFIESAPFFVDEERIQGPTTDEVDSSGVVVHSIERYWPKELYRSESGEQFIKLISNNIDIAERELLSSSSEYTMSRRAKYFVLVSFVSCSAYFTWTVLLPRLKTIYERKYPQEAALVFNIPSE